MSALVLDAGAFVAVERGDRQMVARFRATDAGGLELRSNGAVVAQVWRDASGRQASLSWLLRLLTSGRWTALWASVRELFPEGPAEAMRLMPRW